MVVELIQEVHMEQRNRKVIGSVLKLNVKNTKNQTHVSNNVKIENIQEGIVRHQIGVKVPDVNVIEAVFIISPVKNSIGNDIYKKQKEVVYLNVEGEDIDKV